MDNGTVDRADERPKIAVGVDGSQGSAGGTRVRPRRRDAPGARVRVVCVFEEPDYGAVAYGMTPVAPVRDMTVGLEKAAQQVVEDVRAFTTRPQTP